MKLYGTKAEHFAKISVKNHRHSVNNPYAQFRKEFSLADVIGRQMVYEPMTKLQCCPTSDGAAAAVLVSESFALENGLSDDCVAIIAQEMTTDMYSSFEGRSAMKVVGYDMTRVAAQRAFAKAGVSPNQVSVVELHDCFSANELITYEALGLCPEGKAGQYMLVNSRTVGGISS